MQNHFMELFIIFVQFTHMFTWNHPEIWWRVIEFISWNTFETIWNIGNEASNRASQFIHESCKVLLPWQSILFKSSPLTLILLKLDKLTNLSIYPIYSEYWPTENLTWTDYCCIYSKTFICLSCRQSSQKEGQRL